MAIGRYDSTAELEYHPAALAETLFTQPIPYNGNARASALIGVNGSQTLLPSWAKPLAANDWVLRLHEVSGERGSATLQMAPGWSIQRVDLRDRACGEPMTDNRIAYRPYEIVSLRISPLSP